MNARLTRISKFLSLVLRHKPEVIGLSLDEAGWIDVTELLHACERHGRSITRDDLVAVVEQNDKQRFVIRAGRIRASQGHSLDIELRLEPRQPPEILYHGTAERFLHSILTQGLLRMNRQHVHLTSGREIAHRVGIRHGRPAILRVDAAAMHRAGHAFFLSENSVWLTQSVPAEYLEVL